MAVVALGLPGATADPVSDVENATGELAGCAGIDSEDLASSEPSPLGCSEEPHMIFCRRLIDETVDLGGLLDSNACDRPGGGGSATAVPALFTGLVNENVEDSIDNFDGRRVNHAKVWDCTEFGASEDCGCCGVGDSGFQYSRDGTHCSQGHYYETPFVGGSWNDRIRSVQALDNCARVVLWEHEGYVGSSQECRPSCTSLGGLNGEMSSMRTFPW